MRVAFSRSFGLRSFRLHPAALWLYFTTVLMSIGFHYLETLRTSLSLQWLEKDETPQVLDKLLSVGALGKFATLGLIYLYVAFIAGMSLICSQLIPDRPRPMLETRLAKLI